MHSAGTEPLRASPLPPGQCPPGACRTAAGAPAGSVCPKGCRTLRQVRDGVQHTLHNAQKRRCAAAEVAAKLRALATHALVHCATSAVRRWPRARWAASCETSFRTAPHGRTALYQQKFDPGKAGIVRCSPAAGSPGPPAPMSLGLHTRNSGSTLSSAWHAACTPSLNGRPAGAGSPQPWQVRTQAPLRCGGSWGCTPHARTHQAGGLPESALVCPQPWRRRGSAPHGPSLPPPPREGPPPRDATCLPP